MSAIEQQFSVSLVMEVTRNVAVMSFPAFPKGGTLVILQPEWAGEDPSLSSYAAEVTPRSGAPFLLHYEYWHLNSDHQLGLLTSKMQPVQIPLGSAVKFVPRRRKS